MSKEFARLKGIGSIMFRTIYGFYDKPLLFSCESFTGAIYLLLRLQGENGRWLMVGISEARLEALENNVIEIREPYVNPESGFLYLLHEEGEDIRLDILEHDHLKESMLPYPEEYLDYQKDEDSDCSEHDIIGAAD